MTREWLDEHGREWDLIVECTDNFDAKYLVADYCADSGVPLVWGTVVSMAFQVSVFWSAAPAPVPSLTLRSLHPVKPAPRDDAGLAEGGRAGTRRRSGGYRHGDGGYQGAGGLRGAADWARPHDGRGDAACRRADLRALGLRPVSAPRADVAAIVVGGGGGERLGGVSKPDLILGGVRLIDRVCGVLMEACGAGCVAVVPPSVRVPDGVLRTLEDPPSGGPLAGIDAGLRALGVGDDVLVVVVSVDAPGVGAFLPALLESALGESSDGRIVRGGDPEPFDQYLMGVYRAGALRRNLGRGRGLPRVGSRSGCAPGVARPRG